MPKKMEAGDMVRCRHAKATVGVIEDVSGELITVQVLTGEGAGVRVQVKPSHWTNLGRAKY